MKSIILAIALMLSFMACSGQPAPDGSLPNDVQSVDDKVNSASENDQVSDSGDGDVNSRGSSNRGTEVVYFEFDTFSLSQNNMEIASSNAESLLANSSSIKLEGNCDEWGSDEYNYALGLKRAKAVKDVIVSSGVDASRVSMVSYGESNPACSEKNKSCWSKNRRVETKFLP